MAQLAAADRERGRKGGRTHRRSWALRTLAARAALPMRLVEVGASAGLNLRAEQFCVRRAVRAATATHTRPSC